MKPFDLQVNGYSGVDFCAADLSADELHRACESLRADGFDRILATVITDTVENLSAKLKNLSEMIDKDSLAREVIAGFHVEGPFLNAGPGFAGAHPPDAMSPASIDDAKRILDAAAGKVKLLTLAPENDPAFATTKFLSEKSITVSAGHCDPSLDQLRGAIDNGLSMVTHFGNGCPVELPRHDNVLQRFLHFRDKLWFGFIPDGAHVEFFALKNYLDFIGLDRSFMVTDAIVAAGLGPGIHQLSGMPIEVDEKGVARRPGSKNLAGSTITMPQLLKNLRDPLGFNESEIKALVETNPAKALRDSSL